MKGQTFDGTVLAKLKQLVRSGQVSYCSARLSRAQVPGRLHWWVQGSTSSPTGIVSRLRVKQLGIMPYSRPPNLVYEQCCTPVSFISVHKLFIYATKLYLYPVSSYDNVPSFSSTGPDGAVVMSSTKGLVGTGFASRYRLQPRAGF